MEYKYNTILEKIEAICEKYPKKVALIYEDRKISFSKLKNSIDSVANYLVSYGIKKGDSVGLFLENCWEYVAIVFAITKVGAVAVPINSNIKSKELSYVLDDAKIKLLFAHYRLIDIVKGSTASIDYNKVVWVGEKVTGNSFYDILKLKPLLRTRKRTLNDLAIIFYTSGTSGKSKGVMLSNKNLLFSVESSKDFFSITKRDRVFIMLPMFHNYTLITGTLMPLLSGASIYIDGKNSKKNLLEKIVESRATVFLGIPDIYHTLYKVKIPIKFKLLNRVKTFISGAAPLHIDIINALEKKFKKTLLVEGYGLTEATGAVTANSREDRRVGSVGEILPGVVVKIESSSGKLCKPREVGEILVKSDGVMIGYLNQDELTKERLKDGWLYTRDLGYLDEDGFLYLKGRKSELIIHKGMNVYPLEIESVLDRFNGVKKSAVIGYKNAKGIEKIIAFIELESGEISIEKLDIYARGFLDDYKIPHKYIVIDKLPRNATGKIIKAELENYAIINVNI